jgi:hypothetical protein
MSYLDLLSPWVIYRRLPNLQCQQIARFRKRSTAEKYLAVLQRLQPQSVFELVYEVADGERSSTSAQSDRALTGEGFSISPANSSRTSVAANEVATLFFPAVGASCS